MPWDQQPGETAKNFAAFTAYLALGPTRTLAQTAEATSRTRDQLAHWSQRWRWRPRAAAYHAHLAAVERKATEQLVAEKSHDWAKMHEGIKRQAWAEAEDLISLAQDFKTRWRDSDRLPDFDTIIRALELAFKLKQFAAGMPSEIKAVNTTVTGPDGGPIMVEFEAAVRKIYGKPIQAEVIDVQATPIPPSTTNPGRASSPSEPPSPPNLNLNLIPTQVGPARRAGRPPLLILILILIPPQVGPRCPSGRTRAGRHKTLNSLSRRLVAPKHLSVGGSQTKADQLSTPCRAEARRRRIPSLPLLPPITDHLSLITDHSPMSNFNPYIIQALAAGCPEDQILNFGRAGIILQERQLAASAAARLCDQPDGPTAVGYGGARGGGKSHWLLAQMGADDCQRVPGLKCLLLRKVGKANMEHFEDLRRRLFAGSRHDFSAYRGS